LVLSGTRGLTSVLLLAAIAAFSVGCALTSSTAPSPGPDESPSDLAFCVDQTNSYRASVGLAPLANAADLDAFSAVAVKYDALAGAPHVYFEQTNGDGVSRAEIELLGWRNFTVRDAITQGLAQMWAGGPAGEHYRIIAGSYSQVGCGIFVNGSAVSVAQDFR
jgi:hypothetical protein